MSIKDDFLEEIQLGDAVAVTYGESGALTIRGVVEKFLSSFVVISGKRIRFDSILDYEPLEAGQLSQPVPQPAPAVQTAGSIPAAPAPLGTELECMAAVGELAAAPLLSEDALLDLTGLRAKVKELRLAGKLSGNVTGVLDSLQNAAKQRDRSALLYKLHDWKANVQKLLQQNQDFDAEDALYHLLAVIYVLEGDYIEAAEQFGDAGRYDLAILCHQKLDNPEGVEEYAALGILDSNPIPPYLLRMYAEQAKTSHDVSALCHRMGEDSEEPEERKALLGCAAYLAALAGLTILWPDQNSLNSLINCKAFPLLLPEGWNTDLKHSNFLSLQEWQDQLELPESENQPEEEEPEEQEESELLWDRENVQVFVGTILHFNRGTTHFGWLKCDDKDLLCRRPGSADRFFHINNVLQSDDNLLRQALACGQYQGLEVEYILVDNGRQEPAAGDLRLTERGHEEAKRRVQRLEERLKQGLPVDQSEVRKGYIDEITDYYGKRIGRIDNNYTFRVEDVVDPELKAELEAIYEVPSRGIPVCYVCKKLPNGKRAAVQVRSADKPVLQEETEDAAAKVQEQLKQLHQYDENFAYREEPLWNFLDR